MINALLGERYLKDGVVPTTNEITFLRHTDLDFDEQRCERHPDGQYICYLPAPILKEVRQLTSGFIKSFIDHLVHYVYQTVSNIILS